MKNSNQLSDAIHILTYVAAFQARPTISSAEIANSIETNPTRVRQIMSALKKADLLKTTPGKPKPMLAKKPAEINFLTIFRAIDGQTVFKIDTNTNQDCVIGGNIQPVLQREYGLLQQSVEQEMAKITLQDVLDGIHQQQLLA